MYCAEDIPKDDGPILYNINTIENGKIQIKCGTNTCIKDADEFLKGKFAVYNEVKKDTIDSFDGCNPTQCTDWHWRIESGKINIALGELFTTCASSLKHLKGVVAPLKHRALYVTKGFDKDELTLVPITYNIMLKTQTEKVDGCVYLKTYTDPFKNKTYNVALSPPAQAQEG